MPRPANTIERIKARHVAIIPDGCWQWQGKIGSNGYGHTTLNGRHMLAHRVLYESVKGEIPSGLTIDHLCQNRACVNPDHLEAVTQRENNLRAPTSMTAINRSKTHCDHGHPLEGDNLYIRKDRPGIRQCKRCRADAVARSYKKRRA